MTSRLPGTELVRCGSPRRIAAAPPGPDTEISMRAVCGSTPLASTRRSKSELTRNFARSIGRIRTATSFAARAARNAG
ncbi:hypothetical protein [Piscicoccus intestinalis]|uniref:hypothetical protein n=1 Tax=Piscicoccus intestinalis TaxID=746033 RepID=UPI0008390C33|nr:hypothetical protein [Piscicoccus intestinalis]